MPSKSHGAHLDFEQRMLDSTGPTKTHTEMWHETIFFSSGYKHITYFFYLVLVVTSLSL